MKLSSSYEIKLLYITYLNKGHVIWSVSCFGTELFILVSIYWGAGRHLHDFGFCLVLFLGFFCCCFFLVFFLGYCFFQKSDNTLEVSWYNPVYPQLSSYCRHSSGILKLRETAVWNRKVCFFPLNIRKGVVLSNYLCPCIIRMADAGLWYHLFWIIPTPF